MNEFYEALKSIRNELGLSQKDFAAKIGMKPSAYNMIESGKNQPSFALLNTVVKLFKVDANRLFEKPVNADGGGNSENTEYYTIVKTIGEAEFLNIAQERAQRIRNLYQRLVDIRILLFQELKIKVNLSSQAETDLLHSLATLNQVDDERLCKYPYENLDNEEKVSYLGKTDECITLFTNTFFEHFREFYVGIHILPDPSMKKKMLADRARITDQWKYPHV